MSDPGRLASAAPADRAGRRPLQVGVLTNPRSGGNRNGGMGVAELLARRPDVLRREACDPSGIAGALQDFAAKSVELVVINGGDGTVQATLTRLNSEQPFQRPPLLALLTAGTTSMLPRDIGVAGSPAAALQQVLEWAECARHDLVVRPRAILQVKRGTQQPLYGMFFGAGVICQGIKTFHCRDNPKGWRGQLMPTVTMLRMLLAILRKDRAGVPPLLVNTRLDGRQAQKRAELLVLVSTLERLLLGLRPYWGEEYGPLRYTAIGTDPQRLLRVISALLLSRKSELATAANGYFSHNVQSVRLEMIDEFTLDGEIFSAGGDPVEITPAGTSLFLGSP